MSWFVLHAFGGLSWAVGLRAARGAFAWAVFDDELAFCVLLVLPLFIIQGIFSPVVLNVVAGSVRDTRFHFDAFSEFIVSS
ncbi:MAG: hypothetical protein P8176_11870 [Gammaproteobacteria bacterium]